MTEKRYKLFEHKECDYILDNPNESLDFIEMLGDALSSEEIVNLLNDLHEENQTLLHIIDWCLIHHREVGHIVFDSRDEFFIWLNEKGVLE